MTDKAPVDSTRTSGAPTALFQEETSGAAADLDRAGVNPNWEESWSAGLKPGQFFDTAAPCKALSHLLHQRLSTCGEDLFIGKKALVPGCGRAYVSGITFTLCLTL